MLKESLYDRIGLQFFAADGAGSGSSAADDGSDGGTGAAGTEGNQGAAGSQNDGGTNGNSGTPAGGKTFTQEQVNAMMAREKNSARSAILKELGYEVKDGKYQETVSAIKGILDQGKTQQQLDQEARQKAEGDLTAERNRANNLQAQIDAMKAGVKPDYVDDAIALLSPRVTDDKPLSKLLEESKTKYPNWFGESGGSNGTGNSTNPARNKGNESGSMGKRLAQSNKSASKSSYFHN